MLCELTLDGLPGLPADLDEGSTMPNCWMLSLLALVPFSLAWGEEPRRADVEFHSAAYAFPVSEKTPGEYAKVNPDRKIIEASIRLSADFNLDDEEVDRIEYRLKLPESFEICDYLPKTTLGSEFAREIQVQEGKVRRSVTVVAVDAGAKVGFQMPSVSGEARIGRSENDQQSRDNTSNVRMELLPPRQLVTSASTRDFGRTLHFKMKRFNQITLAGDKDFAFLASVPGDWTGDCFVLECSAARKGGAEASTTSTHLLGLYLSGDVAAKARVESMVKARKPSLAVTPIRPEFTSPPPVPVATPPDPANAKYAGKYTIRWISAPAGHTDKHIEMKEDGTYEATAVNSVFGETSKESGLWKVEDEKLVFTMKQLTSFTVFGTKSMKRNFIWLDSRIKSFDKSSRMLVTESYELKPRP